MPNRRRSIEQVYQLDVRLAYIDPPIWRRILVSDQILLPGLHHMLQVVMGWEHSHLYQFIVGTTRYGETDPEFDDGMLSDRRMRLRDIAAEKGASYLQSNAGMLPGCTPAPDGGGNGGEAIKAKTADIRVHSQESSSRGKV